MAKGVSATLWVVQFVLAVLFVAVGWGKLISRPELVISFARYGYPNHFYLLVGAMESLGAILLVLPRLPSYGATLLVAVMLGAITTHLLHGEFRNALVPAVLVVLLTVIGVMRRPASWKGSSQNAA